MDNIVRRRSLPIIAKFIALGIAVALLFFAAKSILWGIRLAQSTGMTPTLAARLVFDNGAPLESSAGRTNILDRYTIVL